MSARSTVLLAVGGSVAVAYVARLTRTPGDALRRPGEMLRIGFGGAVAALGLTGLAGPAPELASGLAVLLLAGSTLTYGAETTQLVARLVKNGLNIQVRSKGAPLTSDARMSGAPAAGPFAPNTLGDAGYGLDPTFAANLAAMIAAAPGAITISSGFRDSTTQAELWANALAKYGSADAARAWVAPPGHSNHERGLAADLAYESDAISQWAHTNANRFDLTFPLGNEPWHIEPEGIR